MRTGAARIATAAALCLFSSALLTAGSDVAGRVVFSGLPVPGATVTATTGARVVSTLSDQEGVFRLTNLDNGVWTIRVEMRGFAAIKREIAVPTTEAAATDLTFSLTMKSFAESTMAELSDLPQTELPPVAPAAATGTSFASQPDDAAGIINGSSINGAASRFAQARAFGNNRPRVGALYTGGITALLGNSALNAQPYSFGGAAAPIPDHSDVQLGFTLIGPLRIPFVMKYGPQSSLSYQRGVLHNATTQSAVMPTLAQRGGDLSSTSNVLRDPLTSQPFPGNVIPAGRISPQAAALLAYYPLPNAETNTGANYQSPVVSTTTQDHLQFGTQANLSTRTSMRGAFAYQRAITDSVTIFNFADTSRVSSLNATIGWTRRFGQRLQVSGAYRFERASSTVTPFFANRENVSGDAGITGNDQDAINWGPPTLQFPAIADLSAAQYQRSIKAGHSFGVEALVRRGRHNLTIGGDVRLNRFDVSSQPDPRGTLAFTGAATGDPFADFLLGIPSTSSIAFGNTAARLGGRTYDAYINDDLRAGAGLTLNLGLRWEYDTPFTEKSGRMANLEVDPGFTVARTVQGTVLRPDRRGIEPRLGAAWRPVLGSSLVIRGSYGVYRNLGVYQPIGLLLAQQPPFAKAFSVTNNAAAPLTLANPFPASLPSKNTFGIDPNFRPGCLHSWTVSAQRDLPASLTLIAAYFGDKGTHLMQAFLPNTYPAGAVNPCPSCPAGFAYVTSNGTSIRNAAQFTVRRRLYAGFTSTVQYTITKSEDDAATFSNTVVRPASLAVAQDWLDLDAERGPSSFDQRHLLSVDVQYTTGLGVTGGTLVDGFWGALYKDWTFTSQLRAGSGLPLTPVFFAAIEGTGVVGVRPSFTGEPIEPTQSGSYVNSAAFGAPSPGTWGNAGRNSIRGPSQFSLDASLARVFRLRGRMNLEWRVAATNVLNRVTFSSINTVISSPQFGRPTSANQMRRLQMTFRFRF